MRYSAYLAVGGSFGSVCMFGKDAKIRPVVEVCTCQLGCTEKHTSGKFDLCVLLRSVLLLLLLCKLLILDYDCVCFDVDGRIRTSNLQSTLNKSDKYFINACRYCMASHITPN